jgi:hypothetical protein
MLRSPTPEIYTNVIERDRAIVINDELIRRDLGDFLEMIADFRRRTEY